MRGSSAFSFLRIAAGKTLTEENHVPHGLAGPAFYRRHANGIKPSSIARFWQRKTQKSVLFQKRAQTSDMTGPEALTMTEIAERISQAIGKRFAISTLLPRKSASFASCRGRTDRADALDELFAERCRGPQSRVYLGTHKVFGIQSIAFADFARRNAAVSRGEAAAA
jgi:hypothetical protein